MRWTSTLQWIKSNEFALHSNFDHFDNFNVSIHTYCCENEIAEEREHKWKSKRTWSAELKETVFCVGRERHREIKKGREREVEITDQEFCKWEEENGAIEAQFICIIQNNLKH